MPAMVEQMAYTNEVPWHGLGVNVTKNETVASMMKKAGLDWNVDKVPLLRPNGKGHIELTDFFGLVRDKDNSLLDVVGKAYVPTQNADAFEFFREFVQEGKAYMETAGSLRAGRYVWGLANLGESFTLAKGDVVKGYLLVASPHMQGKALIIKFTTVRVVCQNTLALALRGNGDNFRMIHRQEFDAKTRDKAKEVLGIAREQMSEFKENALKLKKTRMSEQDVVDVLCKVFGEDPIKVGDIAGKGTHTLRELMSVYTKAPGADPGNAWGALNAVTYYTDHVISRTPDRRMTQAWFGKTGRQKEKALALLLAE